MEFLDIDGVRCVSSCEAAEDFNYYYSFNALNNMRQCLAQCDWVYGVDSTLSDTPSYFRCESSCSNFNNGSGEPANSTYDPYLAQCSYNCQTDYYVDLINFICVSSCQPEYQYAQRQVSQNGVNFSPVCIQNCASGQTAVENGILFCIACDSLHSTILYQAKQYICSNLTCDYS